MEEIFDFLSSSIEIGETQLSFSVLELFLTLVLPTAAALVFYKLFLLVIKRLLNQAEMGEAGRRNIYRWTKIILRFLRIVLFIILTARLFGAEM
ncbi:MAG: hypothetical protein ACLFST_11835, partial [Spirochaetia bacterium]